MAFAAYIHDEKTYSTNFPYCLHVACTAYMCDEKSYPREFLYCMHMACPEYIRDEKVAPESSPTVSTWPASLYTR
jgi:hypothetical protein